MFNIIVALLVLIAGLTLFAGWSRALGLKRSVSTARNLTDWRTFRLLVLLSFVADLVLIIIALIGLPMTFSYLAGLMLIYLGVLFIYTINLARGIARVSPGPDEAVLAPTAAHSAAAPSPMAEMRTLITTMTATAEHLRDESGKPAGELRIEAIKEASASLLSQSKTLSMLINHLES